MHDNVRRRMVAELYSSLISATLVSIGIGLCTSLVLLKFVPVRAAMIWFALGLGGYLARLVYLRTINKVFVVEYGATVIRPPLYLFVLYSGLVWGLGVLYFLPYASFAYQAFLMTFLVGMAAGSVIHYFYSPSLNRLFVLTATVPGLVWMAVHDEFLQKIMAVAGFLFVGSLLMVARRLYSAVYHSYSQQLTNELLNTDLNTMLLRVEQSNEQLNEEIRERLRVERSLLESEERFRMLSRAATEGVILHNRGTILDVNEAVARISGYSVNELKGMSIFDLIPSEYHERIKTRLQNPNDEAFEIYGLHKDGEQGPIELQAVSAPYQGQSIRVVVVRDLRQRKAMELEVQRLATAVAQLDEGLAITDLEGRVVYCNNAYVEIARTSLDQIKGSRPFVFTCSDTSPGVFDAVHRALADGRSWVGKYVNKRSDGHDYHEWAVVAPVMGERNQVMNYVVVTRDISDEIVRDEQLRQAKKLESVGTLAGGIAHDFNNILAGIIGYAELTMGDVPADSDTYHNLEKLVHAAGRARNLIKQILDFSRLSPKQVQVLDVVEVAGEVGILLRAVVPSFIAIKTNLSEEPLRVAMDPGDLHQMLMNLGVNASQAIGDNNGVITLTVDKIKDSEAAHRLNLQRGSYVRIRVNDTGCGMTREVQERIFDPFYTTKEVGAGTGLGLATVHGIVTGLGGQVCVDSVPGAGSTFTLYLPLAESAGASGDQQKQQAL